MESRKERDTAYMRRCFQLARAGRQEVGANPVVGAVIVHGDRIIGEGWHRAYGQPHAEVEAFNSLPERYRPLLPESSMYVSLEPCDHQGKTPPCTQRILREGIREVKISCLDINPKVAGRGIRRLRAAGLTVETGILESEGQHLIRRFRTFHREKRPHIILKWAQSADGYIGRQGEQVWLTGPLARRWSHRWRTTEAAIMVGTRTALVDNPRLDSRLYPGPSPLRIVLDQHHRIPETHHLLQTDHPTLYVTAAERPRIAVEQWRGDFGPALLPELLSALHERGIKSMLVEGGAALLSSFITAGLWDEARILVARQQHLGAGIPAPALPNALLTKRRPAGPDEIRYLVPKQY